MFVVFTKFVYIVLSLITSTETGFWRSCYLFPIFPWLLCQTQNLFLLAVRMEKGKLDRRKTVLIFMPLEIKVQNVQRVRLLVSSRLRITFV